MTSQTGLIPPGFSATTTSLSDSVIVVTGAGSETGNSVAFSLARAGAIVVLLDKKQRDLVPVYDQITDGGLQEPLMIEFDMLRASGADFESLAGSVSKEYPRLHGLVHCAMWGGPLTPIDHSDQEHWHRILDQQLVRPMTLTKSLSQLINGEHASSVIFTVLDVGRAGRAYWGAIGAAFAGIENLVETLSSEWSGNNTRVNSIDCGRTRTAIRKQFYPGESGTELRKPDDPDITNAYIYLLSSQCELDGFRITIPDQDTA